MIKNNVIDSVSWMSTLGDQQPISALSLPGTHDSAALYGGGVSQCQLLSITAQLEAGVRFLDIRCKLKDHKLKLYHGLIYQHGIFDDVVEACTNFLDENKQETIIICIKNEDNGVSAKEDLAFEEAVYKRINENNWFLKDELPTLGDVRGKIVLMRRFSSINPKGIAVCPGWSDDTTFTIGGRIKIQDRYRITYNEVAEVKWPAAKALFDEMSSANEKMVYINFLSATGGFLGANPVHIALGNEKIPKGMIEYFMEYANSNASLPKRFGWVIFDFPTPEAIQAIISVNQK